MIGIVDYGMGNLLSVYNVFDYLGEDVTICKEAEQLKAVERIVIPGVGAFDECVKHLEERNFLEALNEEVLQKAKPTLGICLGMQVMANGSEEGGGQSNGLGWFDAQVVKIANSDGSRRVPNIGWNEVSYKQDCSLFENVPQNSDFYFVHSYYVKCKEEKDVIASYTYGEEVTAAICKDNIIATQFHPEKSQDLGIELVMNFLDWNP